MQPDQGSHTSVCFRLHDEQVDRVIIASSAGLSFGEQEVWHVVSRHDGFPVFSIPVLRPPVVSGN